MFLAVWSIAEGVRRCCLPMQTIEWEPIRGCYRSRAATLGSVRVDGQDWQVLTHEKYGWCLHACSRKLNVERTWQEQCQKNMLVGFHRFGSFFDLFWPFFVEWIFVIVGQRRLLLKLFECQWLPRSVGRCSGRFSQNRPSNHHVFWDTCLVLQCTLMRDEGHIGNPWKSWDGIFKD